MLGGIFWIIGLGSEPSLILAIRKQDLLKVFESELDDFSQWLANNPNWKQQGPLTQPERVLLRTYFVQKYSGNLDSKKYG